MRAPVVDHARVVVEALVKAAPVVEYECQVEVVRGHLGLAAQQLLQAALPQHEGRRACGRQATRSFSRVTGFAENSASRAIIMSCYQLSLGNEACSDAPHKIPS